MKQKKISGGSRFPILEIIAAVAVILIIAINASLAFQTLNIQSDNYRRVTNSGQIVATLKELHVAVLFAESGQRGYLLTQEEEYLIPYNAALETLGARIRAVQGINTELDDQAADIQRLLKLVALKIQELKSTVNLALDDNERKAMKIVMSGDGQDLHMQISKLVEIIHDREIAFQAKLYHETVQLEKDARLLFTIFTAVSLALVLLVIILLKVSLNKDRTYRSRLEQKTVELDRKVKERTHALTLYADQLSRSNADLEDFAFVASHDLQEPLRKIQTFSDRIHRLYKDKLDSKGVDYLARLANAASRMSILIDDLLKFSRVKTKGSEFSIVDLNLVLANVIDDLEIAISDSDAQVKVDQLPSLRADPTQMNQLFLNILSNALKFRRSNVIPEVLVTYQSVTNVKSGLDIKSHRIDVVDNGVGFDQSFADKVFVPFQRLHARDEYQGTGIGMAVVKKIVERHGGTISVVSEKNVGTTFTIILPAETVDLENELDSFINDEKAIVSEIENENVEKSHIP